MQHQFDSIIARLTDLERSYLDHNETVQKIDKRIWAIVARIHGRRDDGTFDKAVIGKVQKSIIAGKETNPILMALTSDLVDARNLLKSRQDAEAQAMADLAPELPVFDWFTEHRGLKAIMFARFLANAGAGMDNFPTPAHLWSRFGLAVVDGHSQRPRRGEELGFSPRRRAFAIGVLGTNLMMQNPRWKAVYDWRKEYEREQAAAKGITVKAAAAITPKQKATGTFMSDGHVHARARRYMVKQFLKAFWEEWTGESKPEDLPGFIRDKRAA